MTVCTLHELPDGSYGCANCSQPPLKGDYRRQCGNPPTIADRAKASLDPPNASPATPDIIDARMAICQTCSGYDAYRGCPKDHGCRAGDKLVNRLARMSHPCKLWPI
jgi:hypothetical protein